MESVEPTSPKIQFEDWTSAKIYLVQVAPFPKKTGHIYHHKQVSLLAPQTSSTDLHVWSQVGLSSQFLQVLHLVDHFKLCLKND